MSELKCTLILDCRLASFSSKKIASFGKFGRHLSELGLMCGICGASLPKLSINRDASELVADSETCNSSDSDTLTCTRYSCVSSWKT